MPMQTALSTLTADSDKGRVATDHFRDAYNHVGLTDEQGRFLNENKGFPQALRKLIEEYAIPFTAPRGGRIHIVRVPVNEARDWLEAINAAGPDTPSKWDIRKVGDKYPPQEGPSEECEIILVNIGKTIPSGQYALDWAKPYSLHPANPRRTFAVGEHKPQLHTELGVDAIEVVSLEECSFEGARCVPNVRKSSSALRYCNLHLFEHEFDAHCWFAFVCEPKLLGT